jgi:DNA replication protein DnaC
MVNRMSGLKFGTNQETWSATEVYPETDHRSARIFVRRHEAASTLITTNRPTQDWGVFLGDVPAATAILDRFLAHATIVQMTGKSYRLRQRTGGADD